MSDLDDRYCAARARGQAAAAAPEGEPVEGYVNEAALPPVTDGPGSILITEANAGKFKPNY